MYKTNFVIAIVHKKNISRALFKEESSTCEYYDHCDYMLIQYYRLIELSLSNYLNGKFGLFILLFNHYLK